MELAQVLDYCAEWNRQHDPEANTADGKKKKEDGGKRMMTQAEINAFLG